MREDDVLADRLNRAEGRMNQWLADRLEESDRKDNKAREGSEPLNPWKKPKRQPKRRSTLTLWAYQKMTN